MSHLQMAINLYSEEFIRNIVTQNRKISDPSSRIKTTKINYEHHPTWWKEELSSNKYFVILIANDEKIISKNPLE